MDVSSAMFKVATTGAQLLGKQATTRAQKREADFNNIQALAHAIQELVAKCEEACLRASLYGLVDYPPHETDMKIPDATPYQETLMPAVKATGAASRLAENTKKLMDRCAALLWDEEAKEMLLETKDKLVHTEIAHIISSSKFDLELTSRPDDEIEPSEKFLSPREAAKRLSQLCAGIYSERAKALQNYAFLKYRNYPKFLPWRRKSANKSLWEFRTTIVSPISGRGDLRLRYRDR